MSSIAVIGRAAQDSPIISGEGSGSVRAEYIVTPYEGIKTRAALVDVTYHDGYLVDEAVRVAKVFYNIAHQHKYTRMQMLLSL